MDRADVLVTGGAGFIGSHVVRRLVDVGRAVRVFELPGAPIDHLPTDRVTVLRGDIAVRTDVDRAVAGCRFVLHLAANPNLWQHDERQFDRINHRGTVNVIDAAAERGVEKLIHVSTESILAQTTRGRIIDERTRTTLSEMVGPYCRSKWLAEEAARRAIERGLPVTIVSPTAPVGPGDHRPTPLTRLIIDYARGRISGTLDGDLALLDVRDAAAGIVAALDRGRVGERYLLAAENWTTTRLFEALSGITGIRAPRLPVPYPLALAFAHGEQWYCRWFNNRVPIATVAGVKLTRRGMKLDARRSMKELGIEPTSVEQALRDAVDWLTRVGRISVNGRPMTRHAV